MNKLERAFDNELAPLFWKRLRGLKAHIWPSRGPAPRLKAATLNRSITKLQSIVENQLVASKEVNEILRDGCNDKRRWSVKPKGYSAETKRASFKKWWTHQGFPSNCVYEFWQGRSSLYVGRTSHGVNRPAGHFEKHWFPKATRIDVYLFTGIKGCSQFECLLKHRDKPKHNKNTPSKKKYHAHCVICRKTKALRRDVVRLLPL